LDLMPEASLGRVSKRASQDLGWTANSSQLTCALPEGSGSQLPSLSHCQGSQNDAFSLWSSRRDLWPRTHQRNPIEAALQAYVSPSKRYPLHPVPCKLGGTSEPLQATFSSRTSRQTRRRLRASRSSLRHPLQTISQAVKAGDTSEPLQASFLKSNNGARRVEASEPAKPPLLSPDEFS
jgi:hypothetical protein